MNLTDRELQILCYVANGYTILEASEFVNISRRNGMRHSSTIRREIGSNTMAGAIAKALHSGFLVLGKDGNVTCA